MREIAEAGRRRPLRRIAAVVAAVVIAGVVLTVPGSAFATITGARVAGVAEAERANASRNYEIADNCSYYGGQMFGWPRRGACLLAPDGWGGGTADYNWCAGFAKFVWREAGVTWHVSELTGWAQSFLDYGVRHGTFRARASGYPPRPGDAVVFNNDPSNRNRRLIDHVGIVTGVSGGTLYTIEGNTGSPNGVYEKSYPLYASMTSIVGFTTAVGLSGS